MGKTNKQPADDPSSAPESGTDVDETTGNQPASPQQRPDYIHPTPGDQKKSKSEHPRKDDPSIAGEER
jgi:hypothetical protein